MSLQSDLIQYLINLNTAAESRVHDEQIPQKEPLPVIALGEISATQPTTLSGSGLLKRSQTRLAIFARTAPERDVIAQSIRNHFLSFPARSFIGDTRVSSVRVESSADEVAMSDGDNLIKGKGLDLFFVYY